MKCLHIVTDEKFTNSVIDLYNTHPFEDEHDFFVLIGDDECKFYQRNGEWTISVFERHITGLTLWEKLGLLRQAAKTYDYILMHSFFALRKYSILLPRKKLIWIEWGYDLYEYEVESKGRLISTCHNKFTSFLRSRVGAFIAIFPPDIDYYKSHFPNSKARLYYAPYIGNRKKTLSDYKEYAPRDRFKEKRSDTDPIYIMIGHNGQKQLHHIETMRMLKHINGEKIHIVLSMSYGAPSEYIEEVKAAAKEIFGDKATVLTGFIERNKYFEMISKIDIAIFNTTRQTGLGNINRLLLAGTKVFMRKDGAMYDYFRENGFDIQAVESIGNLNYQQMCAPVKNDESRVKAFFNAKADFNAKIQMWSEIYQDLRNNCIQRNEYTR